MTLAQAPRLPETARPAGLPWSQLGRGSLRRRLLWPVSLVTLLTVAALGLHTQRTETQAALDVMRLQAEAMARSVALASVDPMLTDQLDRVEELLLREAAFPGVVAIQVLDAKGAIAGHAQADAGGRPRLVFEPPGSRLAPPDAQPRDAQPPAQPGRTVAWQAVEAGRRLGWVRVEMRTDLLDGLRHQVWLRTGAAGALAVLGSALLLLWLLRAPMRALDEARHFAVALERADGRQLAVAARGTLETVQLGHALNQAATRLDQQRQTIAASLDQLHLQRQQLQDRNLQLASIFALSPDALVSFDAAGCVCFANPAFFRITGLAASAVIGHSQQALADRLGALCADAGAWAGLEPYFELAAASAGEAAAPAAGHLLHLAVPRPTVLLVLGRQAAPGEGAQAQEGQANGSAPGRLLYLRDITHETEVDRLKSEFLSTAAHELRTPIASIYGFSELLRTRQFPPERRDQMLEKIHRNSGVMIRILNDLLDLSRIEARRGADFQREPADLAPLVQQTVADHAVPTGREPPQVLAGSTPLPALIDRGKLERVLGNLLGNAYKYSPAGGAVQVRLLHEATRVGFSVADAGIGMTAAQVARVFERFYRADPSGTILGTGLGMSIVKEIVELHGGTVQVASEPGRGTEVSVWLPALA